MSAFAHDDKDRIPCTMCGRPTRMLGSKLCDGCWECDHNITMRNADHVIRSACKALGISETSAEASALLALAEPIAKAAREHKNG